MMGLLRVMKVVERTASAQVQSVNGRSGRENFHLIGSYGLQSGVDGVFTVRWWFIMIADGACGG